MNLSINLSPEDAALIAEHVASKLAAGKPSAAPAHNLSEWVRGADLNKHIKLSKSTLLEYRERGLIGTAKLGGCLYYYLPDINKLLHSLYYKPEYIRELESKCRAELKRK